MRTPAHSRFPTPPNRLLTTLYRRGFGRILGKLILLLTTTGRKSGRPHTVPLQYEEAAGAYYVGAAMGTQADWVRNILADPHVEIELKSSRFSAVGEVISEPTRIADFIELRLQRHPWIVGRILAMDGLSTHPNRQQLVDYATRIALVILRPQGTVVRR